MNQSAGVQSIESIQDFRAGLLDFCQEVRGALVDVDLEVRRALEWLLERQPAYWQNEVRQSSDALTEAKIELHHAQGRKLPGGGTPSCIEEHKALERAQRRLRLAEEKVRIVRQWSHVEQQEVADYQGSAMQLAALIDGSLPRAVSFLDQATENLERYVTAGQIARAPARKGSAAAAQSGDQPVEQPAENGAPPGDGPQVPPNPSGESTS